MELWTLGVVGGAVALLFAMYLVSRILKMDTGTEKMTNISHLVQRGAAAYLRRQCFCRTILWNRASPSFWAPSVPGPLGTSA
jgi:K(+)-stimulated pyrophosphate-energized sodium pump